MQRRSDSVHFEVERGTQNCYYDNYQNNTITLGIQVKHSWLYNGFKKNEIK